MVFIKVQNTYEHKYLRMDYWNTPVLAVSINSAHKFETVEEAIELIRKFNLVSTGYVHDVIDFNTDNVLATCSLQIDKKSGKLSLDVKYTK